MIEYLPYITFSLTFLLGIISFFLKRELDNKDKEFIRLESKVDTLELRVRSTEVSGEKLNGRIDTVIEILERLEKKLENL